MTTGLSRRRSDPKSAGPAGSAAHWTERHGLFGGLATYLAGQLLFVQRMHLALSGVRLVAVGVLLAGIPLAALVPPLAALALLVLIVAALVVVDTIRHADLRRQLRGSS
ncbi:low temperature requirement protein A [Micromonospora lupini]|nr:hypothetical protein [Micromonospora lupini]MCX5070338.1 low temperature requirement protein A [Micromonospora lupini]